MAGSGAHVGDRPGGRTGVRSGSVASPVALFVLTGLAGQAAGDRSSLRGEEVQQWMTLCRGSSFPMPTSSRVATGEIELPRNLSSRLLPPRSTLRISRWLSQWRSDRFLASRNRRPMRSATQPAGPRQRFRAFHHTPAPAAGDCASVQAEREYVAARTSSLILATCTPDTSCELIDFP